MHLLLWLELLNEPGKRGVLDAPFKSHSCLYGNNAFAPRLLTLQREEEGGRPTKNEETAQLSRVGRRRRTCALSQFSHPFHKSIFAPTKKTPPTPSSRGGLTFFHGEINSENCCLFLPPPSASEERGEQWGNKDGCLKKLECVCVCMVQYLAGRGLVSYATPNYTHRVIRNGESDHQ